MMWSPLVVLLAIATLAAAERLPDKFFGHFRLDHSENFEEYLTAKGYGWFTRKLVMFARFDKVFTKATGDKFNMDNLTTKKDVHYRDVVLGKEFTGDGLDSTNHRVLFYMKGDRLYEKHVVPDPQAREKDETYAYYFVGDALVIEMESHGVVAKRFYKKI